MRLAQEKRRPIARRGCVKPLAIKDAGEILDLRRWNLRQRFARQGELIERSYWLSRNGLTPATSSKPKTYSVFLQANKEFRIHVVRTSGNDRLVAIVSDLLDELERYFRLCFLTAPERSQPIQQLNKQVTAALLEGRAVEARDGTAKLLELARSQILDVLSARDEVMKQSLWVQ